MLGHCLGRPLPFEQALCQKTLHLELERPAVMSTGASKALVGVLVLQVVVGICIIPRI